MSDAEVKKELARLEKTLADSLSPEQRQLLKDGSFRGRAARVARTKFASSLSDAQLSAFIAVKDTKIALLPEEEQRIRREFAAKLRKR